jgi:putative efflux protein, MATE family
VIKTLTNKYLGDRVFWERAVRLAIPIALQNLLMSIYSLVDTLMVSSLGDVALSSVGMANQWGWLMQLAMFGLSSGASVFIAQYWGVHDTKKIHNIYGLTLIHMLVVSLLFGTIAICFPNFVIGLFNDEIPVIQSGVKYLIFVCIAYPSYALTTTFSTVLRSTEYVHLPMYVSILTTLENIVLNYILIFGHFGAPAMGVAGAAIATAISSWTGSIALLIISIKTKNTLRAPFADLIGFSRALVKRFYKIAMPVMLNEFLWALGTVCYNIIYGHLGYQYYTGVTIFRTVEGIAFVFFVGLCNACCVMVGKAIGAGKPDEAYQDALRFSVLVPLISVFVGLAAILLRGPIVSIFNTGGELSDVTLNTAMGIMVIYGCMVPFRNIPYIQIVGIFRSGGDTVTGMKYDLACVWLIALPLTALAAFVFKFPFLGVYATMAVGEDCVKFILCIRRFISKKWIKPVTEQGMSALSDLQ